jgi:hypothetical protein
MCDNNYTEKRIEGFIEALKEKADEITECLLDEIQGHLVMIKLLRELHNTMGDILTDYQDFAERNTA